MEEKNQVQELKDQLFYTPKNVYSKEGIADQIMDYAQGYKTYLDRAKTEREAVRYSIELAEKNGYVCYNFGDKIEKGGKYYYNNRDKSLFFFKIGTQSPEEGIYISAAHIDSPRLDLKQCPVYEDGGMGYFKTHYYGGIKKYQWTSMPLAIHGSVVLSDNSKIDIVIGEDENDPVFCINDLLPHLAKDQMAKTLAEGITGEALNVVVGSRAYNDEEGADAIKLNVLKILNDKYGIKEDDFLSAEINVVPAFKARDIGLDRSLIGGYGHDDRVCAYPALTAIFESDSSDKNLMVVLADKEEIGSVGNTGMQSNVFTDLIEEIAIAMGANPRVTRMNSKCLSADVNAAYDPNFAEVYERRNSAFVNHGVVLSKYTGARGKSGTSDASAEFVGYVRSVLDAEGVVWQTAELGKVDQGGGGTVAAYIANLNINVVDLGVPVLSMHAPYEVISKADLYMTHKAFAAFNK